MLLVSLLEAYHEESAPTAKEGESETRIVMKFPKHLAPIQVAVLPLSKKKNYQVSQKVLPKIYANIFPLTTTKPSRLENATAGRDEIGTPYCVTVDFDSLNDKAVTVRDRDTMEQERVSIAEIVDYLKKKYV